MKEVVGIVDRTRWRMLSELLTELQFSCAVEQSSIKTEDEQRNSLQRGGSTAEEGSDREMKMLAARKSAERGAGAAEREKWNAAAEEERSESPSERRLWYHESNLKARGGIEEDED